MLKQDHAGEFPLQDFLSSDIGLDDTRVVGAEDGKQVVDAGLCRSDVTCERQGETDANWTHGHAPRPEPPGRHRQRHMKMPLTGQTCCHYHVSMNERTNE